MQKRDGRGGDLCLWRCAHTVSPSVSPHLHICLLCLCLLPTTVCTPPSFHYWRSLLAASWPLSVSPCLFWPCPRVVSPSISRVSRVFLCFLVSLRSGTRGLSSSVRPHGGAASRSPAACKRKEQEQQKERALQPKKQRLVFTDLQRRTLIAIFKENKRPSKEMQVTISQQLGLELNTVSNFFMNARRRCMNRWAEEPGAAPGGPVGAAATFSKA